MVKVIAYCLFWHPLTHPNGFINRYMAGLFEIIRTRDLYFPDWHIHITYDTTLFLNKEISNLFQAIQHYADHPSNNLSLQQNRQHISQRMYVKAGHRFLPITNDNNKAGMKINYQDIEYILFRDIDSPLPQKDREFVDNWITSNTHAVMAYHCVGINLSELENKGINHIFASGEEYHDKNKPLLQEQEKNYMKYAAGGVSINIQLLSKLITLPLPSYLEFTSQHLDNYKSLFKNKLSDSELDICIFFDEYYLAQNLNINQKDILKIPMTIARSGEWSSKWYDVDTLLKTDWEVARETPLIDYVNLKNSAQIKTIQQTIDHLMKCTCLSCLHIKILCGV